MTTVKDKRRWMCADQILSDKYTHLLGAGDQIQVLVPARPVLSHWSVLPAPNDAFYFFGVGGSVGVWTQGLTLVRQVSSTWATMPTLFGVGYFQDGISWTVCPGWLQTSILLIPWCCFLICELILCLPKQWMKCVWNIKTCLYFKAKSKPAIK
jgi:hypothetical protein